MVDMPANDDPEAAALMAKFGITRVPADNFHYRSFRYSKLSDAIAQAQRDAWRP